MSQPGAEEHPGAKLRRVGYMRWTGIWGSWEPVENDLLGFVYDYFTGVGACGVFPPFHLLNVFLLHGGGGGGMGPGAKWEPFSLSREEYDLLVHAIGSVEPGSIEGLEGPVPIPFTFDPEFDGDAASYLIYPGYKKLPAAIRCDDLHPYFLWATAVCGKHRDAWRARRAGGGR